MKTQLSFLKDKNCLNGFESKMFPIGKQIHEIEHSGTLSTRAKVFERLQLKILTSKQIF